MGGIQVTPYRPQSENLLDQVTRLQQLKNAQQQNALQGQEVQGAQLENQQREIDLKSQQAIMKAYGDNNGDLDKTLLQASKNGAKPGDLIKLRQAGIEQQKSNLELLTAKGARALQEADLMQGAHDAVGAAPAEQKPVVYQQQLAGLQQAGVDISKTPPEYPGDRAFALMGAGIKGHKQQLEDLAKQIGIQKDVAQTGEASSRAHEADVNAQKTQQEMQFGTGPMADSRYRFIQQQKVLGRPVSAEDAAFQKAYEKQKQIVPQFNFNLQNAGATGQGGQPSAIAKAIADGSMKRNDAVSARTPMAVKQALLAEVKGINPQFNSGDFTVEQKVKEDFTSGADSNSLNAINRAREHMQVFLQTAKDLDNGNVQAFNRIGQAFGTQFGGDKATNLGIAKQAFSSEVGKAFAGSNVGVSDRQEIGDKIDAASSFTQLAGVARTADSLLAGAQKVLKQKYDQGIQGKPNFGQPSASGVIYARDPQGKLHQAPAGTQLPDGWKLENK